MNDHRLGTVGDESVHNGARGPSGAQHHDVRAVDHRAESGTQCIHEALSVGAIAEKDTVAHEQRVHRLGSGRDLTRFVAQLVGRALERTGDRQGIERGPEQSLQVGRVQKIDLYARRGAVQSRKTKSYVVQTRRE